MKKFLTYTWPLFVYLLLIIVEFSIKIFSDTSTIIKFNYYSPTPHDLIISLGGIYYLLTSPFGKTQIRSLSILLLCRLLFNSLPLGNSLVPSLIYISIDLFLLIFFLLRSLEKEELLTHAYLKLIIFILIVLSWELSTLTKGFFGELWFTGFENLELWELQEDIALFGGILELVFIILHINMLYKRKDASSSSYEEKLIEDLGKESN